MRESEELMDGARERVKATMLKGLSPNMRDWPALKSEVKEALSGFIFSKTGRSPMILPIIMEV